MTSPVLAWRESGTEGIRPNKNLRAVEASAIQNPSEHSSFLSGTRSRNRIDRVSSIFEASLRLLSRSAFLLERDHALSLVAFTLVRVRYQWVDRSRSRRGNFGKAAGSRHRTSADLVLHLNPPMAHSWRQTQSRSNGLLYSYETVFRRVPIKDRHFNQQFLRRGRRNDSIADKFTHTKPCNVEAIIAMILTLQGNI